MNTPDGVTKAFDLRTLERIATVVCSDDGRLLYRTGNQLAQLFEHAGWREARFYDGSARRMWVLAHLKKRRADRSRLLRFVTAAVDPRDYEDMNPKIRGNVIEDLNRALKYEQLELVEHSTKVVIQEIDSTADDTPRPLRKEWLKIEVPLGEVVHDSSLLPLLENRLGEARRCISVEAYLAATIILGSLLEGVLLDVYRQQKGRDIRRDAPPLAELIKIARDEEWIGEDLARYSNVLRDHRNIVHPRKQLAESFTPDVGAARMGWNLVAAIIDDLVRKAPVIPTQRKNSSDAS